ncbi:IclR family transcriptional regulator [Sphingobium aquiterrae]|uniref:IclR family transcriptional regulator n=1 Tax=Sphingobium aquiterrae TaxID=2038656 RepID=UPI00301702DB
MRRAAAILWLLARRKAPLTLSEIARATGMLPSTALHILRELAAADLIETDERSKKYGLGNGILALAGAAGRRDPFADLSEPYLHDIADRHNVTATATALIDDRHTACVISISPPSDLSLNVTLGGRVPRLAGAAGRCIAMHAKERPEDLQREFQNIRWQIPLPFDRWWDEVDQVRVKGFAEDDGVFSLGVVTLAAAVVNPDNSIAGVIGAASISATLDGDRKRRIAESLLAAAEAIAGALKTQSA